MGFRNSSYATVWSVEAGSGNFTKVRLSVSKKNKDGAYEQDFSGFCMFIGTARAKAEKLREKDRIVLKEVDVSTTYDKERNKEYVNYKVFDFDFANEVPAAGKNAPNAEPAPEEGNVGDEDAPF